MLHRKLNFPGLESNQNKIAVQTTWEFSDGNAVVTSKQGMYCVSTPYELTWYNRASDRDRRSAEQENEAKL